MARIQSLTLMSEAMLTPRKRPRKAVQADTKFKLKAFLYERPEEINTAKSPAAMQCPLEGEGEGRRMVKRGKWARKIGGEIIISMCSK